MPKHIQQEEQSVLAPEVRVRPATAVWLSLLRSHVEEIVQHPRTRAQKAPRVQSERGGLVAQTIRNGYGRRKRSGDRVSFLTRAYRVSL